jgi:hypothetical protein
MSKENKSLKELYGEEVRGEILLSTADCVGKTKKEIEDLLSIRREELKREMKKLKPSPLDGRFLAG